jgi:hypothetical protein
LRKSSARLSLIDGGAGDLLSGGAGVLEDLARLQLLEDKLTLAGMPDEEELDPFWLGPGGPPYPFLLLRWYLEASKVAGSRLRAAACSRLEGCRQQVACCNAAGCKGAGCRLRRTQCGHAQGAQHATRQCSQREAKPLHGVVLAFRTRCASRVPYFRKPNLGYIG